MSGPARGVAPAKINLALHVTGRRADGYHLLDSLVVFADLGDRLRYEPGGALSLNVAGPFAEAVPQDERNLVWQAAVLAGWRGRIVLEKNLPHGAGIGGGSADAAAALRDLGADPTLAARLGADVPVCLSTAPQRMRGIGEDLAPVANLPALDLVLVNPGVPLPTPRVFVALDMPDNPAMTDPPAGPGFLDWLADQRNDLEAPAIRCLPAISTVLAALGDADLARMSGSGATCFGIYADAAAAHGAAARLRAAHPGWWVVAVRTFASTVQSSRATT